MYILRLYHVLEGMARREGNAPSSLVLETDILLLNYRRIRDYFSAGPIGHLA